MRDLASRPANRVQLTTDGHRVYLNAVDAAFHRDIDYAMLVKHYASVPEGEVRYSPAVCTGAEKPTIRGRSLPAARGCREAWSASSDACPQFWPRRDRLDESRR